MQASYEVACADPELQARSRFWHETNSVTYNGAFKQWLHVFCLTTGDGDVPCIKLSRAFPWVNVMPKPCIETLTATHHMTRMANFPDDWKDWQWKVSEVMLEARAPKRYGPYWMLLRAPGPQVLAQELVTMKRRIHNEMFRDADPWSAAEFELRVAESMEPFLIYPLEKT